MFLCRKIEIKMMVKMKIKMRDDIVLWELSEPKCQQRMCQHTDVVQIGQAGWMVLILQWKTVKFPARSALVTV